MTIASLTVSRFDGLAARLWAFADMQRAHAGLRGVDGLTFYRLCGSGSREGFDPRPNFGVYAVVAAWATREHAERALAEADVFRRRRARAAETWSVLLRPVSARGSWSGATPFTPLEGGASAVAPAPVAVLTRGSVRFGVLGRFWSRTPGISADIAADPAVLFKLGMGEVPWVNQITFSIWRDLEAARAFAYRRPAHREAARAAKAGRWFREDLFAHFAVVGELGSWGGRAPLAVNA